MTAAGAPEPRSPRSGIAAALVGSPLVFSAVPGVVTGHWSGLSGVVLLYSWVALMVHVGHVLARWPAGQIRRLPSNAYKYIAGELVFALAWGWALRMASEGRALLAAPALAFALVLVVLCELEIAEALRAGGAPHVSDWLYARRVGGRTVEELFSYVGLAVPGAETPVSRLRRNAKRAVGVILGVFVLTVLATAADAASDIAADLEPPDSSPTTSTSSPPHPAEPSGQGGQNSNDRSPASEAVVPVDPSFVDICGEDAILPGHLAPPWAAHDLFELYFKPGSGLGAAIAGCPEPAVVLSDDFDTVAYQLGLSEGVVRSVSVSGLGGRSAMLLGAPARYAAKMLRSGVALSGFPRADLDLGDMYVLWSRMGTTVFLRSSKNAELSVGRYVRLDGRGTLEWVSLMDRRSEWLWPREAADDDDVHRHVHFVDSSGVIAGEFRWDADGTEAAPWAGARLTVDEIVSRHRK